MRRAKRALLVVGFVVCGGGAVACSHTRTVEEGETVTAGHETPPKDRPPGAARAAASPATAPNATPPKDRPAAEASPPLAASPAGLLKPGAEKKIQERLADAGLLDEKEPSGTLDGPTQKALRELQRDSGLPATGIPDDATVRKLGLDPGEIFKTSTESN